MVNLIDKLKWLGVILLLLSISETTLAQRNYTLYSLDNTGQSHYLNPAYKPSANIYIGIPAISMHSIGASNSGFNMSHLLNERPQDDSLQLNPDNAVSKMGKRNFMTMESVNEIISFGFRLNKNYFSFNISNRLNADFIYTKDLFQLAVEGNGKSFLGERASFDDTGVNLKSYVEYAIGFNREISDKLNLGARVKFLSGIANVNTRESKFGLHTDKTTFDLTVDGSATVNTSGVKPFYDTLAPDDYDPSSKAYNFNNFGLAFDLGATYELTDKINLSASVLDLGFISWKEENATFTIDDINYRFEGVNINEFLKDTSDAVIEQLRDTLEGIFSQDETNEKYTTGLATRFYLGGSFDLTEKINIGATLYNEIIKSRYRVAAIVSGRIRLKKW